MGEEQAWAGRLRSLAWPLGAGLFVVLIALVIRRFENLRGCVETPGFALIGVFVLIVFSRLVGLGEPLLDRHDFRQTQTALSAYWFATEGVSLPDYALPVLGRPWSAPMEFPTYQFLVAGLHRAGVPLDLAAQGLALVCFALSCVLLGWILMREKCPREVLMPAALLALLSPFALVWSRASMIEFTAVLAGLGYVGVTAEAHRRGFSTGLFAALLGAGMLAAITKITSFTVFWPAVALLAGHALLTGLRPDLQLGRTIRQGLLWLAALLIPLAAAVLWTRLSDEVKIQSVATEWLTSDRLSGWNFGSLAQRMDWANWGVLFKRLSRSLAPVVWPLALIGLPLVFILPLRAAIIALGLVGGALGTVAVFFNLYVEHDYYLCAVALPFWLCVGLGLHGLLKLVPRRAWAGPLAWSVMGVLLGFAALKSPQVRGSFRDLTREPVLHFARQVEKLTPPDAELIVLGEDWNPRIAYYARRKAFMVNRPVITDTFAKQYAARHRVPYLVAAQSNAEEAASLFPAAKPVYEAGGFILYRLLEKGPSPEQSF